MNAILLAPDRNRLVNILGRLGSDFDGERAAAGLLATRMLRDHGLSWDDLLLQSTPTLPTPVDWRELVAACRRSNALTKWEIDFLAAVAVRARPTSKQMVVLEQIAAKVSSR